jgi:hypothetical protein
MAFTQRIQPPGDPRCTGHDPAGCAVIDCITTSAVTSHETGQIIHEARTVVWHSHMDAAIHPEHRLNPDHPAEDHRVTPPVPVTVTPWCGECGAHPAAQFAGSPTVSLR